jgi:hypothetical protein
LLQINVTGHRDISTIKLTHLTYGPAGSGKTWLGYTYPKHLFVCTEEGLLNFELNKKEVPFIAVPDYNALIQVLPTIIGTGNQYQSIILDSLTEVTTIVADQARREASKSITAKMDRNTWGIAVDKLRIFVRELLSLKVTHNIVVIARSVVEKDEVLGDIVAMPDTIGKFAQSISGYFDLFTYQEAATQWQNGVASAKWNMHTVQFGRFPAKDRTGRLLALEPNDYSVFSPKIYGQQEEKHA